MQKRRDKSAMSGFSSYPSSAQAPQNSGSGSSTRNFALDRFVSDEGPWVARVIESSGFGTEGIATTKTAGAAPISSSNVATQGSAGATASTVSSNAATQGSARSA